MLILSKDFLEVLLLSNPNEAKQTIRNSFMKEKTIRVSNVRRERWKKMVPRAATGLT